MSAQPSFPNDRSPYYAPRQNQSQDEDFKASYDDLIDEYSAPYAANSRHQTFAVETSMNSDLRRGPSYPLAQKAAFSKHSDDISQDTSHVAYPPLPPTKEVDTRGFWEKVCHRTQFASDLHPTDPRRSCLSHWRVDSTLSPFL